MVLYNKINNGKGYQFVIFRFKSNPKQILGRFAIFSEDDECIFSGGTLEPPFLNNKQNLSCIPAGLYKARKTKTNHLGSCIAIDNVINRSAIFMHVGNYYTDIKGCILVGKGFKDINNDNLVDVYLSLNTMNSILQLMQPNFELLIFNNY